MHCLTAISTDCGKAARKSVFRLKESPDVIYIRAVS